MTSVTQPPGREETPAPPDDVNRQQIHSPEAGAPTQADARLARLAAGVAGLGRRRGVDTERILLIAGSIVLPLGVVFILLGWAGAAHTTRLFEQIPYLISGGILGGALVVAGGFLYFGYWLTRLVYEGRAQSRQMTELLTRMADRFDSLESLPARASAEPGPGSASANGAAPAGGANLLVATATGTMLHRPDCSVVANKDGLRRLSPDAEGFRPCRICDPFPDTGV